eukprot:12919346-Prorocentrum_lima.AAC.1
MVIFRTDACTASNATLVAAVCVVIVSRKNGSVLCSCLSLLALTHNLSLSLAPFLDIAHAVWVSASRP